MDICETWHMIMIINVDKLASYNRSTKQNLLCFKKQQAFQLREAFKKKKSINKVNVLICLDPLPPPPNKEKKN